MRPWRTKKGEGRRIGEEGEEEEKKKGKGEQGEGLRRRGEGRTRMDGGGNRNQYVKDDIRRSSFSSY